MDILYAFDENYAPFAGISLFSLLENNRNAPRIRIFAVTEGVCEHTLEKWKSMVQKFERELILIDIASLLPCMREFALPSYRGSYAANARLFGDAFLPPDVERLLYLDGDTLVCADLSPLLQAELGGCPVGAVQDALTARYKTLLGFSESEPYFNSGVLLIDVPCWKSKKVPQRVKKHAQSARLYPDQDVLNLALRGEIAALHPRYNLQPQHLVFDDNAYLAVYPQAAYHTGQMLQEARTSPAILHAYRFLGDFPWHTGNHHPNTAEWDAYMRRSPWCDLKKKHARRGPLFKIEKLLYHLLPKRHFLSLFAHVSFKKAKKAFKKNKTE